MSYFDTDNSTNSSTSIVHRAAGGIAGVREVFDDASRLTVCAFPFAMVRHIVAGKAAVPACYILADHESIYIGESNNVGRRLSEHLSDIAKAFAREVFVIAGLGDSGFDKSSAVYLQWSLTRMAEQAGLVVVQKGVSPRVLDLPAWRRATLDRIVDDGQRLLFDSGCRAFHSSYASMRRELPDLDASAPEIACDANDTDDVGEMEIGVIATPRGVGDFELVYGDLWARGYPSDDGFVVTAGSEVRSLINASVNPIVHTRRAELATAGVLAEIPGLTDRQRLMVSVWFPSAAIAAKVITGAHVASNKWTALRHPQPFIIAA
jgi:predicted GIY-YIG superfamily endonuclease